MKRLPILLASIIIALAANAAPVDIQKAQIAGTHFLQKKLTLQSDSRLTLYTGQRQFEGLYIFNLDSRGFVIVGADDRCTPILGYSLNGSFEAETAPTNFLAWLEDCSESIQKGIKADAPQDPSTLKLWNELLNQPTQGAAEAKSDTYLLTSTWEQGSGYNNYCPVLNGKHVVVGCIATAMAQIIRYYGVPSRGFGHKSYREPYYGILSVDFDTTEYDYSLMPDHISRRSTAAERDMVSRLCYHCGIVTNMTYQSPDHTSGSGSYNNRVPEALTYFGYTNAMHYNRMNLNNDSLWVALIRNEIDNRRPIEYSGYGDDGGHAFVLDGYNNDNQYHFNWGWGGYADGFYSLTTMAGFTLDHEMTINIYPSGWDGHLNRFLVSPDGHGNGTTWDQANCDYNAAIILSHLNNKEIWFKEGIYTGDTTNADYAFQFSHPATIIGGFEGTETSINQHNPKDHPTILSGQGSRGVLYAHCNAYNSQMKIYNFIIQDGHSTNKHVLDLTGDVQAKYITIHDCRSDSGQLVGLYNSSLLVASDIYNNQAPTICYANSSSIRQSLIYNNDGDVLTLTTNSKAINCNIVSNHGTGATFRTTNNTFINNIVWNNDTNLHIDSLLSLNNFHHCAVEGDAVFEDSTIVWLSSENEHSQGPRFKHPSLTQGIEGYDSQLDWHLMRGSACINAGQRQFESNPDGDFDGALRTRQGATDIGCYETNYPVGIDNPQTAQTLNVFPNPATTTLTLTNCTPGPIQLFDMTGRKVVEATANADTLTLDISQLPKGVYFLKSGPNTIKLVKR